MNLRIDARDGIVPRISAKAVMYVGLGLVSIAGCARPDRSVPYAPEPLVRPTAPGALAAQPGLIPMDSSVLPSVGSDGVRDLSQVCAGEKTEGYRALLERPFEPLTLVQEATRTTSGDVVSLAVGVTDKGRRGAEVTFVQNELAGSPLITSQMVDSGNIVVFDSVVGDSTQGDRYELVLREDGRLQLDMLCNIEVDPHEMPPLQDAS